MSSTTVEWLAVAIFFICFFGFTVFEAFLLNKKNITTFRRGFAYSMATNSLSISVGFFVSFVIAGILLALAWDGTLQNVSGNDWRIWTAVITAGLFPVVLLMLAKRLSIRLFGMTSVTSPWLFSTASSIVFHILVVGVPILFIYFA